MPSYTKKGHIPLWKHESRDPKHRDYVERAKVDSARFIYNKYPWVTRQRERRDIESRLEAKRERDADLRMIEIADRVFAAQMREQRNIKRSVKRFAHVLNK